MSYAAAMLPAVQFTMSLPMPRHAEEPGTTCEDPSPVGARALELRAARETTAPMASIGSRPLFPRIGANWVAP